MSITQISSFSASWTVTRAVTMAASTASDSMFRSLMSIGQKARDAGKVQQVKGLDLSSVLPQFGADAAADTLVPDSLFTYWANLTATEERFHVGDGIYKSGSRYITLMEDYADWKREQPDSGLPEALGAEEDDLAWLKERFSGELGAFEIVDAIESMFSMGMIDRYERSSIYGLELTVVKVTELTSTMQVHPAGYDPYRSDGFENAPLHEFRTLDDILAWLGKFRAQPVADWELQRRDLLQRMGIEERVSTPV